MRPLVLHLPCFHDFIALTLAIVASFSVLVGNAALSRLIHIFEVPLIPGATLSLLRLRKQETMSLLAFNQLCC